MRVQNVERMSVKNKNSKGASIKNTPSQPLFKGRFFEQKQLSRIQYNAVYEALDELTVQGYTTMQIEEIIRLGLEQYKKK